MAIVVNRIPWPDDFPETVIHGDLRTRNAHPNYAAAKSGNADAAVSLVADLLTAEGIEKIGGLCEGRAVVVLPVAALETAGFNAIPDAMAQVIARRLGLTAVSGSVIQSNKVAHTGADGWHRLVTPATFTGAITAGADYFLVDDHVGFGGTLANLRGYIEVAGAHILGMTALTETGGGRHVAIRHETRSMLGAKHGQALDAFWHAVFGYGTDCLTDLEAGYLSRVESLDAIRNRMAQAAEQARRRGLSPVRFGSGP